MSDRRNANNARVLTADQVAEQFGRTRQWFYRKREKLEQAGFPLKDLLLGGWLASLVDAWFVARGRVDGSKADEDPYRAAIRMVTRKT